MADNTTPSAVAREAAVAYLTAIFSGIVREAGVGLERAEDLFLSEGHSLMAEAMGRALEAYDADVCSTLPEGVRIHDRRRRCLATKVGDVTFLWRRCRDAAGCTVIPLADALDLPWGARVSPAARSFLVDAGAGVSFASAATLLGSAGGSRVSSTTVMAAVHRAGELCAREDEAAARSLYGDGVLPRAESSAPELCIEADGTWIRLQGQPEGAPQRVEIKALVSYAGKDAGSGKARRVGAVRHGCVGTPSEFWSQGIAAIGSRYDLASLKAVHFGCDGEALYGAGASYLPSSVAADTHLDPFHVNRAVLSCFPPECRALANNVLGCAIDGDAESAAALIEAAEELGLAKKGASRVAGYLRSNREIVYAGGPSLGTMEAEQQHVYGCRMDAVPCAWSRKGADAMARIRSRSCSKRDVPRPGRADSVTPRRARRTERRALEHLESKKCKVPKTVGKGRGAEHFASVATAPASVRYIAGVDRGMVAAEW